MSILQTRAVGTPSSVGVGTEWYGPKCVRSLVICSFLTTCKFLQYALDDITRRAGRLLGKNQIHSSSAERLVSEWGLILFPLVLFSICERRCSGENALLEIFLSTSHIAGNRFNKCLIPPLGLSISKMKYNLTCLRLFYNLGAPLGLDIYEALNGLYTQRHKYRYF